MTEETFDAIHKYNLAELEKASLMIKENRRRIPFLVLAVVLAGIGFVIAITTDSLISLLFTASGIGLLTFHAIPFYKTTTKINRIHNRIKANQDKIQEVIDNDGRIPLN